MNYKQLTRHTINLFVYLLIGFQFCNLSAQAATFDTVSGRMTYAMYYGPGGIESAYKRTIFADVKNLSFDLNIAEISKRFGCKTKLGQSFIVYKMSKPISHLDTTGMIEKSQNMIRLFVEHPELQEKFSKLLQEAIEHEEVVMKFMAKRFVMDADGNPINFVNQWMQRNPLIQTFKLGSTALDLYGLPEKLADKSQPIKKHAQGTFDAASNVISSAPDFVTDNLMLSGAVGAGTVALTKHLSNEYVQLLLAGAVLLGAYKTPGLWDFGWAVQDVMWTSYVGACGLMALVSHYAQAKEIRNALHSLNQLVQIAKNIEDVCREHNIKNQFALSSIRSSTGRELLEKLQHSRYEDKNSLFFLTTAVHSFLFDVYERDMTLAPVYASLAEIDAYVAIAQKMIELQQSNRKLTFTQFLDDEQPAIQAQGFWNLLVPDDKIVTNDISEHRNIILTGSNEGGKTTAIRAILQNIVLAQTFGIAAATEFKLTHFDVIHSFLNVSDDILNGKSRFASELKQAQDILKRIQELQTGEKFFFAFDELFTGTNGEDGAQCAYQFINNIASYKNIQFIYATHFNILKTIGAHNPACANYKIEPPLRNAQGGFIRDEKGQLIYPYKLSPGANDVNVAMDRARDAGIFA